MNIAIGFGVAFVATGATVPSVKGSILLCDADILWLGEEAQGFFAVFAANTACFHAAERNTEIAHEPAVYSDRSGVNPLRDTVRAIQVLRPDAARALQLARCVAK